MTDYEKPIYAPTFFNTYSLNFACANLNGVRAGAVLTWVANLALYIPFYLPVAYPIQRVFVSTTGVSACNYDLGIYTADGDQIFHIGSTARSSAAVLYTTPSGAPILLEPGFYYYGIAADTAVAVFNGGSTGVVARFYTASGVREQTTAFPLPATMASSVTTRQFYPLAGFTST